MPRKPPELGRRRAQVIKAADALAACIARGPEGQRINSRCKLPCCPSCQRGVAQRHNRRLAAKLSEAPRDRLRFVRLSVVPGDDTVAEGLRVLGRALTKLRRRTIWTKAVAGGVQHIEPAAARDDSARRWNIHMHLVLLLHEGASLDTAALAAAWTQALTDDGAIGSVDVVHNVTLGGDQ